MLIFDARTNTQVAGIAANKPLGLQIKQPRLRLLRLKTNLLFTNSENLSNEKSQIVVTLSN